MIRVVDIFAGPGGLSEGFAATTDGRGRQVFDLALSIEKDEAAHETLRLRTFFRLFPKSAPADYYRLLRGEIDLKQLYTAYPAEAKLSAARCWHATLVPDGESAEQVRRRMKKAVGNQTSWVLIGGPPCQAYSIAGRSRNRGNPEYDPKKDVRQRLYVEYLQILAEHRPAVFIMENVKGLLSATLENERVFHRILDDLRDPAAAMTREGRGGSYVRKGGYRIHSLSEACVFENGTLDGSVIRAEQFGIPQARHRVILLGIRDDIGGLKLGRLTPQKPVSTSSVLKGLPRLRSGLTPRSKDSAQAWRECLQSQADSRWANAGTRKVDSDALSGLIRDKLASITLPDADRGGEFLRAEITVGYVTGHLRGVA